MRKNSKNEKVIRAMAIGISAMLMASSPLTALAAEGEGTTPEGNEDKNITVTPEAGIADQAQAAAKEADKAVETAEKSATDVKSEVADQVVAGEAKDTQGKDLSQAVLDANVKVEDKTVEGGSSLKDAESAVESADTKLGVAEANDKLSDAELNKATDAAANAGQTAAGEGSVYANMAATFTVASGYAFLAFNLLCAPCFAAMGAIKREMNNTRWFWIAIGYQCGLAYVVSLCVYQIGTLITTGAFGIGTVVAFLLIIGFIYLLFRPYKESTTLKVDSRKVA